ncbi:MAG: hypothetical protein O7H41_13230, partial [Planctomycetota bacterium]|nr:hypothetical protein [Planctomycetota bacterium]
MNMDSLIFCFVILLAVGGLVLLIVAITKSTMGGARAFQCEVCCSTVGLSMGSCRACGAGSDRPGQDRLKHYRASLWDLRSFYNNGKIPFDTYALLDGLFRERASHVIQNLGSRRGHLAKVPNYPDETMASASEKEPEPVTDGVVKEPEEVEAPPFVETEPPARAAPEEERLAPTPRPAPPVSPELAEWKWQEILAKTFFFLGVLAATALAFSSLYTYGGEYHPLLFMIFPGATLGIFAAAIAVKRLFDFTWSSLAFSLLSAVLLPICYYAAARFQVVSIERPMLEWGWVALGCSILYALGSRVAGERTLLFLAALSAPTGFAMILGESALREGFLAVSLLVPAGAYLAYAERKAGDPFRGPVFRLAAFTNIVAGLLLVLILKSIGAADLLDISITGWALAALVFVVGLRSGRD